MGRSLAGRRGGSPVGGGPPIRLRVLAIGKIRNGPLAELQALYAARIVPPIAIVELEARQRLPAVVQKAREAALILTALPARARLIALDERGAMWSSNGLADRLAACRDQGIAELAFAIGGADGLGAEVLDRAETTLSLGPMTWPHQLVRSLLLEQLYRAQQILAGHPYHRQ